MNLTDQQKRYALLAVGALGGGTFLFADRRIPRYTGGAAFFVACFLWFREFGGLPSLGTFFGSGPNTGTTSADLMQIPLTPQHVVRVKPGICRDASGNILPAQTSPYPYAEVTLDHIRSALSPGGMCEGATPYSADDARLIAAWNVQVDAGLHPGYV